MATTPSPVVPDQITKTESFLKTHERLLIIFLCLIAGLYIYHRTINAWEAHDQRADNLAHATLQANVTTANQLAAKNATAAQQYQALAAQLADANKALATAQAARNTATTTQQAVDKTLPPNDLANRWTTLLNIPAQSIQVNPNGLSLTPDAATTTVVQLETIPTLQANLKDEQTTVANQATQITSLTNVNVGLNKQIDALNVENADEIKASTADKNLLKAQARKSKLRWFAIGFGTGWLARQAVKSFVGI